MDANTMVKQIRRAFRFGEKLPTFSEIDLDKVFKVYDEEIWTVRDEWELHKEWEISKCGFDPDCDHVDSDEED